MDDPSTAGSQLQSVGLTPQQKMAMALMQQQGASNPQGQYSPLQGISQIANNAIATQLMRQSNPGFQLGNNVSQAALRNANTSTDPLGALAATQGWNQ